MTEIQSEDAMPVMFVYLRRDIGRVHGSTSSHRPDPGRQVRVTHDACSVIQSHAVITANVGDHKSVADTGALEKSSVDAGIVEGLDRTGCPARGQSDISIRPGVDDEKVSIRHLDSLAQSKPFQVGRRLQLQVHRARPVGGSVFRDIDAVGHSLTL